jgi:hypothetical protein
MPERAANPPALLCDADSLIQLCLCDKKALAVLRTLATDYAVQAVVTPEVETEVLSNRKFGKQVTDPFQRALRNGVIRVFDYDSPARVVPELAGAVSADPGAVASIRARAKLLNRYIHRGEAYTHAAAEAVGVPILSNDRDAILTRERVGYPCVTTVLRAFDIVVFGLQISQLSIRDCEEFRSKLERLDSVPRAFRHVAFEAGLPSFASRLVDTDSASICASNQGRRPFEKTIEITRRPEVPSRST